MNTPLLPLDSALKTIQSSASGVPIEVRNCIERGVTERHVQFVQRLVLDSRVREMELAKRLAGLANCAILNQQSEGILVFDLTTSTLRQRIGPTLEVKQFDDLSLRDLRGIASTIAGKYLQPKRLVRIEVARYKTYGYMMISVL